MEILRFVQKGISVSETLIEPIKYCGIGEDFLFGQRDKVILRTIVD